MIESNEQKNQEVTFPIEGKLGGRYRVSILDENNNPSWCEILETGEIFTESDWKDNLVTEFFLENLSTFDVVATTTGVNVPRSALVVGSGALTVKTDSGLITATQAGNIVTSSAGLFTVAQVGDLIRWDSGQIAKITVFTSATQVTVDVSQNVSAGEFTIENIDIPQLVTFVGSSTSEGGFNSGGLRNQIIQGNELIATFLITRVYTVTANGNFTEFGFSPLTNGTQLNIVENFRNAGGIAVTLSILSGKKIRVDHTLEVRLPLLTQQVSMDIESVDAGNITYPRILSVSNASPIEVVVDRAHGYTTGQRVTLENVLGNTVANGSWVITTTGTDRFTLNTSVGNGAYTPGSGKLLKNMIVDCTLHLPFASLTTSYAQSLINLWQPFTLHNSVYLEDDINPNTSPNDAGWVDVSGNGQIITFTNDAYVVNSRKRIKRATMPEGLAPNTTIYGVRFARGYSVSFDTGVGFKICFPANDSWFKSDTHTWQIATESSWSRL